MSNSAPATRYRRRADIHFTDLPTGGIALLDPTRSVFHGSNPVGKRIWDLLAEPRTLDEVVRTLQQEYDVDPKICRTEVQAFFERLLKEELIEECPD